MLSPGEQNLLEDSRSNLDAARAEGDDTQVAFYQGLIDKLESKAAGTNTGIFTNPNGSVTVDHNVVGDDAFGDVLTSLGAGGFIDSLMDIKNGVLPGVSFDVFDSRTIKSPLGPYPVGGGVPVAPGVTVPGVSKSTLDEISNGLSNVIGDGKLTPILIGGGVIAAIIMIFKVILGGKS